MLLHSVSSVSAETSFAIRPSTCSHSSVAGQELCYLCHQRAQCNVPVDVSAEREAAEKEEERLLQEYQHQHDLLALAREQAKRMKCRNYNQEIASFNFQSTEKRVGAAYTTCETSVYCAHIFNPKMQKVKNEKSSEFHVSYLLKTQSIGTSMPWWAPLPSALICVPAASTDPSQTPEAAGLLLQAGQAGGWQAGPAAGPPGTPGESAVGGAATAI